MLQSIVLASPKSLYAPTDALYNYSDTNTISRLARGVASRGFASIVTVFARHDGKQEVLTGEPHRLAAIHAGLTEIPVHIYEGDTSPIGLLLQRLRDKDTRARMNACELGRRYGTILKAKRWNQAALSGHLNISECLVAKPLSIVTNLCPELQRRHVSGTLPMETAYYLSRVRDPAKQLQLAACLDSLTREDLKREVNRIRATG